MSVDISVDMSVDTAHSKIDPSPVHFFKLMGIVNSIPNEWKLIIKQSQHHICSPSNDTFQINIENATVNVLKVTSKMLYNEFQRKKQTVPAAQKKIIELKYPDLSLEWKDIYSLPFTVTHDTKTREFQYKLLNNIVFANDKLFRFKMIDSPLCAFCQREVESSEHLFFHCNGTKSFWQLLCSWMSEQKVISTPLTLEIVIFGAFNIVEDFHILNHIILLAKCYFYKCKLNIIHPSLKVFIAKVKATCQTEQKIAASGNKLVKRYKKWNKFPPCFS